MSKISWNNTKNVMLNYYENEKKVFHISPEKNSNLKYVYVIKNSELIFAFDINNENINLECYFIIPATINQNVKLDIDTYFTSKNTKAVINVIALWSDNSSITLDGNIHIWKHLKNIEAKLYEETLLLWDAKYISLIPWLRVDSPDVVASHWAKIQRISQERIFYMQSRWLDKERAITMIIDSYSQQIIEKFQLNEDEKSKFYSMMK